MKTILLSILVIVSVISATAQKSTRIQSNNIDPKAAIIQQHITDEPTNTSAVYTPDHRRIYKSATSAPGVVETQIGGTIYDYQTNNSISNRIYFYPDGSIGAVWTMGFNPSNGTFPDRGTGYNYFNGSRWEAEPSARIEPVRTGWPSYCPLEDGEVVVAHDGVNGLQISKRPVRGTGAWTTTLLPGPALVKDMICPRVISSGNTLHILVCSGAVYEGLDLALLYYRSLDGGTTWENPRILPGLDAASLGAAPNTSFKGFGGDDYSWALPKGDTIAFVVSSGFRGIWVMKSFDNGTTWTQTTVSLVPTFTVAPSPWIHSNDGNVALALDSENKAHVVFGRMWVNDDDYNDPAGGTFYRPYTDGLLYWEEGMPVLDTNQLGEPDSLDAHGNLLAWMKDYSGNDTIDFPEVPDSKFPFGLYSGSLSSMGQIVIDENDNIYVTYSSCREDKFNANALPNIELYRHLYLVSKMKAEGVWCEASDLTDDLEHDWDECVYASMSYTNNDRLHILVQLDGEPGTAVGNDEDPYGDNYVWYFTFPTFVGVKPVETAKDILVWPNPANDFTQVQLSLQDTRSVELNVFDAMGKLVIIEKYGELSQGPHTFKVNTGTLQPGIYLFRIKAGSNLVTRKVVVY